MCVDYETSEEESVERPRKRDLYGFVDHPQLQQRSHRNEFAPRRLSQSDGNMNGWLLEDEDEVERNEVDSDLESTASSKPVCYVKMAPNRQSGPSSSNNNENPDVATLIAQQLQAIITQVANNARMANNGNKGDDGKGCDSADSSIQEPWKMYIAGLAPEIRGMLRATQPTTIQNAILRRAGILTDEAVSCVTTKKARTGTGFVATAPTRNETVGYYPRCSKCYTHHPENRTCRLCFNCQKPGHFAKDCQAPNRQAAPVNAVRMNNNPRVCHECGSPDHFRNTCPKLNRAPGQTGNQLAIEGRRNNRSNGNQVRGRAYNVNVNAMEAVQDPNVVTVIGFKGELHENTEVREILFLYCYAFGVSLLLTPLCCDDIHDVTPRVFALAGCDKLVSEPMVIEN
ncbi:reverse transcriptase domain-containing protein [Tanacetum coccineum]